MKDLTPEIGDCAGQHHKTWWEILSVKVLQKPTEWHWDITPEINDNNRQHHRHDEIYFGSTGTINWLSERPNSEIGDCAGQHHKTWWDIP